MADGRGSHKAADLMRLFVVVLLFVRSQQGVLMIVGQAPWNEV
jgi:hypothetical protein